MGGRGSLSSSAHKMYNPSTIKSEMTNHGIRLVGADRIKPKGLSSVVSILEDVQYFQKKHGKNFDTVLVGVGKGTDPVFIPNYKATTKSGKEVTLGRTLVIPQSIAKNGHSTLRVKTSKGRLEIKKNTKQQIAIEYGRAIHYTLQRTNPKAYKELDKKVKSLVQRPNARIKMSNRINKTTNDYVAEAVSHLVRNTTSRRGQDMIDLVRDYASKVSGTDFSRYGLKARQTYTIKGRRR